MLVQAMVLIRINRENLTIFLKLLHLNWIAFAYCSVGVGDTLFLVPGQGPHPWVSTQIPIQQLIMDRRKLRTPNFGCIPVLHHQAQVLCMREGHKVLYLVHKAPYLSIYVRLEIPLYCPIQTCLKDQAPTPSVESVGKAGEWRRHAFWLRCGAGAMLNQGVQQCK